MTEQNPFVAPRTKKLSDLVDLSYLDMGKRNFSGATTKKKKNGPPYGPAAHSFQKAFAPSSMDTDGGSSVNWSGINASGVNIGSNTAAGPATAATESLNKFIPFLESLETEENSPVINVIKTAFEACFDKKD